MIPAQRQKLERLRALLDAELGDEYRWTNTEITLLEIIDTLEAQLAERKQFVADVKVDLDEHEKLLERLDQRDAAMREARFLIENSGKHYRGCLCRTCERARAWLAANAGEE